MKTRYILFIVALLFAAACGPGEYDGSPEASKRVVRAYLDSALVEPDSYEEVAIKADTNFVVRKGGDHGLAPWRDTVSVKDALVGRVDSEVDVVYRATNEFGGTSMFDEIFLVSPRRRSHPPARPPRWSTRLTLLLRLPHQRFC